MNKVEIHSELSAQGRYSKPNPLVHISLKLLTSEGRLGLIDKIKLVDLGCGRLRHLDIFKNFSKHIILVDTVIQIEKSQKYGDSYCNMIQYVESLRRKENYDVSVRKFDDFEMQEHQADIVFSIAVMNSVTKDVRLRNILAAYKNLSSGGYFVVITPRNDSTILRKCNIDNRYQDGYIFRNRGHNSFTFFNNYRNPTSLLKLLTDNGFTLVDDLSTFHQICFILIK